MAKTKKIKTKSLLLCTNCHSDNVQVRTWVNPNTNKIITDGNLINELFDGGENCNDCFCNVCKGYRVLYRADLNEDAKIIGYQVIGTNEGNHMGEIHPKINDKSYVYNLTQAKQMIEPNLDDDGGILDWKVIAVWSDGIKNPVLMFEGDPNN